MGEEKNELVEKIQVKLGRVLTSQEREILEAENFLGASELGFPEATQKILASWRSSFKKIARLYSPGTQVSSYASNALLRCAKKFNRNFLSASITVGILLVLVAVLGLLFAPTIPLKFGIVVMAVIIFVIEAFVILETRRLLGIFQQKAGFKAVILELVDCSTGLNDIYTCTPRPWREIFLGSHPKDLEGMAKLVAWNLDWYLTRPSVHFRWSWIVGLVVIVASFAIGMVLWNAFSFTPIIFCILLWFNLLPIIHSLESWRKLTGLALLIEETKRMFSEAESE